MANEMIARSLKALADPTRLQILELLSTCCCGKAAISESGEVANPTAGEVCCQITGADKITSTISHHLHELEGAGLIRIERRGKCSVCALNPEGLKAAADYLHTLADGGIQNDCC